MMRAISQQSSFWIVIFFFIIALFSSSSSTTSTTALAATSFANINTPSLLSSNQRQQQHSIGSRTALRNRSSRYNHNNNVSGAWAVLRGGEQQEESWADSNYDDDDDDDDSVDSSSSLSGVTATSIPKMASMIGTFVSSMGTWYGKQLVANPILTKSATAGCIFWLSDYVSQQIEEKQQQRRRGGSANTKTTTPTAPALNWKRTWYAAAVGFLYFGPAAHVWYSMIFKVFPGTGLGSILQKAVAGQLLFGPAFTCIFFASSLLQSNQFSAKNWLGKIRQDLPTAWLAGAGFWPFVDLVSYSLIAPDWIPLFVNMCSLVWTVYLCLIANRRR